MNRYQRRDLIAFLAFVWLAMVVHPLEQAESAGPSEDCEVRAIRQLLRSKHVDDRLEGVTRAARLGVQSAWAVESLFGALSDSNPDVRSEAAKALGSFGSSVIPRLTKGVADPDPRVRDGVIEALSHQRDKTAIPTMPLAEAILHDKDESVRQGAIMLLAELGDRGLDPLIEALKNGFREDKIFILGRIGACFGPRGKAATPLVLKLIMDQDQDLSVSAVRTLGELQDERALPILIDMLRNTKPARAKWRFHALVAMESFEVLPQEAVDAILDVLSEPLPAHPFFLDNPTEEQEMHYYYAFQIRDQGPLIAAKYPEKSRDGLLTLLRRTDAFDKGYLLKGLVWIKGIAEHIVPDLKLMLEHRDCVVKQTALMFLARLGPEARDALPGIKKAIADTNPETSIEAALALRCVDPGDRDALAVMLKHLDHHDASVRRLTLVTVNSFKGFAVKLSAEEAQPLALKGLRDSDAHVLLQAIYLADDLRIKAAIPDLQRLSTIAPAEKVKREAQQTLERLIPRVKPAVQ